MDLSFSVQNVTSWHPARWCDVTGHCDIMIDWPVIRCDKLLVYHCISSKLSFAKKIKWSVNYFQIGK